MKPGGQRARRSLTHGADHEKRACSISVAIRLVISAAGLADRTGPRPGSLPRWTTAGVYERTRDHAGSPG